MKEIDKVLLIVNPISGGINKRNINQKIDSEVSKLNAELEVYQTTGENDQKKIKNLVASETFDRILIAGGDGTIKLVAEALLPHKTPIAIIPAGSANGLALNLGIPNDLQEQLNIAFGNTVTKMDVLEINGELCLHMGDLGINAELIKNYQKSRIRGKMGYLLQSIPTLLYSKYPFEFEIQMEDKSFTKEGILLAFANAKKYGTGANVNPKGKINDGVFELLLFKNFNMLEILKTLRNETEVNSEFVEIIPLKEARVYCKNPVSFQIDGEYIGEEEEIYVKISPEKLSITTY
ncbi:YegS/Rv2252/BmrU family lipid kinase [uncultured Salegentibacter sp.]|uniref:diacylglycerol/lipid kinase family protein n=1 Tax=uncultured Salegentibacter sp. TaxID=259320 RepID=UPI0025986547|nr:YegS/Rv2252/BmrU family lipid kinase [uncultured Salegentibacter sp.]